MKINTLKKRPHPHLVASMLRGLAGVFCCLLLFNFAKVDRETIPSSHTIATMSYDFQEREITGNVTSASGEPLLGVNILLLGSARGTQTDFDGNYKIKASKGDILEFSFVGKLKRRATIGDSNVVNIVMADDSEALDDIVIVSFGKQKKKNIISSVTTVKPSELKIPSSNLTTALAGRVSGLIAYQRSGEPGIGTNDASFFIRGVTSFGYGNAPLILIDGVELTTRDLARLQPDDISEFSILKDASATALYGARGANGVIFVTTKGGVEGPAQLSFRMETSLSQPTRKLELADPITFMLLHNEAARTRSQTNSNGLELPYSLEKVGKTIAGENPLLYPVTDWKDELIKNHTINKRINLNVKGGGRIGKYYVSLAGSQDTGILKVPKASSYNTNIDYQQYVLRSNVDLALSESTNMKMIFTANYDNYRGPLDSGENFYKNKILKANPVLFRPYYEKTPETAYINHILFGNYAEDPTHINPLADLLKGYRESQSNKVIGQIELSQNLDAITKGLNAKFVVNATRQSSNTLNRSYTPFYYAPVENRETGEITYETLNEEQGTEFLNYNETGKRVNSSTYVETRLSYSKNDIKDLYDVSGLLVFTMRNRNFSNAGSLQSSLPYRNLGLAGRFTFAAYDRYLMEFNFGYNGSERFADNNRWGYFPSLAFGWIASNEDFLKDNDIISLLKFKVSYGLAGSDQIGGANDRFFYLSEVTLNSNSRSYTTGEEFGKALRGTAIDRYANNRIRWETATKLNLGLNLELFKSLELEVNYFTEKRSSILANRIVPKSVGLEATVRANVGEAKSHGIDGSLVFNKSFNKNFWLQARTNFTYTTNEVIKREEPDYSATPWLSRIGRPINQSWGLVAERLFVDQYEVDNSPRQDFGAYTGGDIKYRDINGDGVISNLDQVPIGNPTVPEIVYGFGVSVGYKQFDFSFFFQGLANESFWVDNNATAPFIQGDNPIGTNQLLKAWADSHWSEANRDIYARWPRLATYKVDNNTQRSTWFMQDGSFLRLKSVEFGYTLPNKTTERIGLNNLRFYVSGTNLLLFSKFKLWDPEMAGNGLGYPTQRVFNAGLRVSL